VRAVIAALKEQRITIVLVEQSTQRGLDTADRVLDLETGRKTWEGTGADVREDPVIIEAYLGTSQAASGE